MFAAAVYYVFSGAPESRSQPHLRVQPDPLEENVVIFAWAGAVYPPMAKEMSEAFDLWKDKTDRIIIELDSPGGLLDEGGRVIKVIQRMRNTHAVWTYVGPDSDCLSMCVPIYLQGRMRVAAPTSRWLFHDATAVDIYSGAEIVMYSHERALANLEFFNRYIEQSDINPKWRDDLRAQMSIGDVWKTGQELKDERSNIVTILD